MNLVFRTYCHAFHIVSRLALPFLPYRNPTIYDSVTKVAPLAAPARRPVGAAGDRRVFADLRHDVAPGVASRRARHSLRGL